MEYNYLKAMQEDIENALDEMGYLATLNIYTREELEEELNDTLWTDDSVTGNASGSYTFSREEAKKYFFEDGVNYLDDMISDFGIEASTLGDKLASLDWEWFDVSVRCYLLGQAISTVLDGLEEEGLLIA